MPLSNLLADVSAGVKEATVEELRLALESVQAGAWSVNVLTGEVHTAGIYAQLIGGPDAPPDFFYADFTEFLSRIHPDDRQLVAENSERMLTEGGSFTEEFRIFWPDGTMRWLSSQGRVLSDSDGQPVAAVGVLMDMTERKEVEADRQELLSAEHRARTEAEQARAMAEARGQRLAQVESVTEAGLAHLSVDELLAELLGRVRGALAVDVVVVSLRTSEGPMAVRASLGLDGQEDDLADREDEHPVEQRSVRSSPLVIEDLDASSCPVPYLAGQGLRSLVEVCLVVEGRTTGVLHIGTRRPRHYSGADIHLLQLTADRMALAIDRVQAFEREHSVAETLQRSLLPDTLPDLPEADLASIYRPGAASTVGGDWYDVIPLPTGHVVLVMGDTVGSGVRAASVMGQLRGACRIYAGEGHEPAEVVRSLNRFALSLGKGEMATLIYLVLDPDSGQAVLVNAGHPPPLVRHADGRCEYLGPEPNLPLGVQPSARYVEHPVELPPDATVLLYTDGLTERRDRSLDEGFEHLAAAMGAAPTEPQAACEHVLRAMLGNEQPNDDVALLALHRTHVAAHGVDLRLPAEASALPHLRRVLRNWLDQVGADDQESYDIVLATSEAAANVSEHAYGPAEAHYEVKGTVDEGIVQIAVRDFGRWRPPRGTNRGRGLLLMNALTDDVAIHHGGAGTEVRLGKRLANPTSTSKETALVHH